MQRMRQTLNNRVTPKSNGKEGLSISGNADFGNGLGLGVENGRNGTTGSLTILGSQQGTVDQNGNYEANANFLAEINGQDIIDLNNARQQQREAEENERNPAKNAKDAKDAATKEPEEGPSGLVDVGAALFTGGLAALTAYGARLMAGGSGSSSTTAPAGNTANAETPVVGRKPRDENEKDGKVKGEGDTKDEPPKKQPTKEELANFKDNIFLNTTRAATDDYLAKLDAQGVDTKEMRAHAEALRAKGVRDLTQAEIQAKRDKAEAARVNSVADNNDKAKDPYKSPLRNPNLNEVPVMDTDSVPSHIKEGIKQYNALMDAYNKNGDKGVKELIESGNYTPEQKEALREEVNSDKFKENSKQRAAETNKPLIKGSEFGDINKGAAEGFMHSVKGDLLSILSLSPMALTPSQNEKGEPLKPTSVAVDERLAKEKAEKLKDKSEAYKKSYEDAENIYTIGGLLSGVKGLGPLALAKGKALLAAAKSGTLLKSIGGSLAALPFFRTTKSKMLSFADELATQLPKNKDLLNPTVVLEGQSKVYFKPAISNADNEGIIVGMAKSKDLMDRNRMLANVDALNGLNKKVAELAIKNGQENVIRVLPVEIRNGVYNPKTMQYGTAIVTPEIPNATNAIKATEKSVAALKSEFSKIPKDKIGKTIADLEKAKEFSRTNNIGDFQGIIDKDTGHFYVIDPNRFTSGGNSENIIQINIWIDTLKDMQK